MVDDPKKKGQRKETDLVGASIFFPPPRGPDGKDQEGREPTIVSVPGLEHGEDPLPDTWGAQWEPKAWCICMAGAGAHIGCR